MLSAHQLPARLLGNWYTSSGEWRYGLYGSYAVTNGDFWSYKNVVIRKTGGFLITLNKGADTMLFEISEKAGHSVVVKNEIKAETLYDVPSTRKDFGSHTDAAYPKSVFNKGLFVLKGVVGGFKTGASPKAAMIYGMFVRSKFQHLGRIDSAGKFELSFSLLAPQYLLIEYGDNLYRIWAEPYRELMCFIRPGVKPGSYPLAFSGDLGLLNEELQDYEAHRNMKYSSDTFRSQLARQKNVALHCKAVSAYYKQLDSLSKAVMNNYHYCDKSRQLISMDVLYERFQFRYPAFGLNHADSVYLRKWQRKFLAPLEEKEEDGILSDNYWFFINQQVRDSSGFSKKFEQAAWPLQHSEVTLSDVMPVMEQLKEEGSLNEMEVEMVNSLKELPLQRKLDTTIIKENSSLFQKHQEYINTQLAMITQNKTDSIMSDVITQSTQAAIKESKYSVFSKDIFLVYQINMFPQIHAKVYQRLFPMIVSAGLKQVAEATARETDFQFDDAQSMQVFQQVFNPYKGKILYVDFWGTYCTPCWRESKFMEKLRSHLKEKDVVFVFICVDDKRNKWLADKEKFAPGAEHLFVEGDTATILKAMFNVSAVPHSVIIGRDGNVVSADAPRPMLQQEIDNLINAAY